MKIELRAVKYAAFASEETSCFSATVYLEDARAGIVSNDGRGGCNRYEPYALQKRLDTYGKTLPKKHCHGMDLEMDADLLIGDVLDQFLALRDLKRALQRRILYSKGGKVYQTKAYPAHTVTSLLRHPERLAPLKAEKILNTMPEAEALALYLAVH